MGSEREGSVKMVWQKKMNLKSFHEEKRIEEKTRTSIRRAEEEEKKTANDVKPATRKKRCREKISPLRVYK